MKLKFGSKSQEFAIDGTVTGTKVTLTNDEGAFYPVMLPVNKVRLSNTELEELALEVIYQENFPNRAENEKFNTIGKKISEIDDAIERANGQYTKMEQMMQNITTTMNALLDGGEDEKTTTSVE